MSSSYTFTKKPSRLCTTSPNRRLMINRLLYRYYGDTVCLQTQAVRRTGGCSTLPRRNWGGGSWRVNITTPEGCKTKKVVYLLIWPSFLFGILIAPGYTGCFINIGSVNSWLSIIGGLGYLKPDAHRDIFLKDAHQSKIYFIYYYSSFQESKHSLIILSVWLTKKL